MIGNYCLSDVGRDHKRFFGDSSVRDMYSRHIDYKTSLHPMVAENRLECSSQLGYVRGGVFSEFTLGGIWKFELRPLISTISQPPASASGP